MALCITILFIGIIIQLTGIFIFYDFKSHKLFKFKVFNRNEVKIILNNKELLS